MRCFQVKNREERLRQEEEDLLRRRRSAHEARERVIAGCRVQGSGCRVQGAGCRVQSAGFGVQGAGCRVQGSGFGIDSLLVLKFFIDNLLVRIHFILVMTRLTRLQGNCSNVRAGPLTRLPGCLAHA
jgi:hypothetical protein